MMVVEPQEAGTHQGGQHAVIATVADKRLGGFPNVPTIKEAGYNIPWCRRCAAS